MLRRWWSSSSDARRGALAAFGLSAAIAVAFGWRSEAAAGSKAAHGATAPSAAAKQTAPSSAQLQPRTHVVDPITIRPARHPLEGLSDAELDALLRRAPEQLGSASLGRPNRGKLLNGVALQPGAGIDVVQPKHAYGTELAVRSVERAVAGVLSEFPDSPELHVGDLSRKAGGYLRPHRSHQSGLDVDIGYYYRTPSRWYTKATRENLDAARTWALLKAFVSQGNVEYVFMDRSVQALLREHAEELGEPRELLDELFEGPTRRRSSLVRHAYRHLTHFHVRFVDRIAEETGRRVFPRLRRLGRL